MRRISDRKAVIPIGQIEQRILLIRGQKVMPDADLAELYGVTTKRLNEQVKRNRARFPEDVVFQVTAKEKSEGVAKCDHLSKLNRNGPDAEVPMAAIASHVSKRIPLTYTYKIHIIE